MNKSNQQEDDQLIVQLQDIDKPDELDRSWKGQFKSVNSLLTEQVNGVSVPKSDNEINTILLSEANDPKRNGEHMTGLLYGLLSDRTNGEKYLQYMHWIVRDKFTWCLSQVKRLASEKWRKLTDTCRIQLLWLTSKFVEEDVVQMAEVVQILMRQVVIGCIKEDNIYLIEKLLDICQHNNMKWLYSQSAISLIPYVFITFSGVVLDHFDPVFNELQVKEIQLCVRLFQEKFSTLRMIGRDLVRMVIMCNSIPEFDSLWKDMMFNPTRLAPDFTDIWSLLRTRSPRVYIAARITPEVEQWILFLMKHVSCGNERRYQEWFRDRYLVPFETKRYKKTY